MSIYCPYCGNALPDNSCFCIKCGKKLPNADISQKTNTSMISKTDQKNDEFDIYIDNVEKILSKCTKYRNNGKIEKYNNYFHNACEYYDMFWNTLSSEDILDCDDTYLRISKLNNVWNTFFTYASELDYDLSEAKTEALCYIELLYGGAYCNDKKYRVAIQHLNSALSYDTDLFKATIYNYLGQAYDGLNDSEKALASFNESLKYEWGNVEVWALKSGALLDLNRYNDAIDASKTVLELVGNDDMGKIYSFLVNIVIDSSNFLLSKFDSVLSNCKNISDDIGGLLDLQSKISECTTTNDEVISTISSAVALRCYVYSLALTITNSSIEMSKKYMDMSKQMCPDLDSVDDYKDLLSEINYHFERGVVSKSMPLNNQNVNSSSTGHENNTLNLMLSKLNGNIHSLDETLSELNGLIGLSSVKKEIGSLVNVVQNRKKRKEAGLHVPELSLHMVFSGNPGTGKTTVARIVAQIYKELGLIKTGQLIEVDRSKLVSGYLGQTAIQTQEVINSAVGGVLFIDEAYTLSNSKKSGEDYGQEAIDTLLKAMEDNRDNLVVIVAGYPDLMDSFLKSNPGLESRFNTFIHFEDYNASELFELLEYNCKKNGMYLSDEACIYSKALFEKCCENLPQNFSNGRYVRNIFEKACRNQDNRVANIHNPSRDELTKLIVDDFEGIWIN